MINSWREIPPTAGLPLRWRDFLPSSSLSLEAELATWLHLPSVQTECSGTATFIVALTALKKSSMRCEVIVPAYTCPLVVRALQHCRLRPVLCDLKANHFDLCPQTLATLCNERTLAIVPTHLGGRVADLAEVSAIARGTGAYVIEDAAQALGATWKNQPVGTVGDVGFYSLAAGKGLTLYEGGVLVTRNNELRALLRETGAQTVNRSLSREAWRWLQLLGYAVLYGPRGLRLAYGLPLRHALRSNRLIEAVGDDFPVDVPLHRVGRWRRMIGARALQRLPSFLADLEARAAARKRQLETIPGIAVMGDAVNGRGTWPFLMVLMPSSGMRDASLNRLWTAGLGVSRLFVHALPDYPYLRDVLGDAHVPHARDFAARMLTISNSPWQRDDDFEQICRVLAEITGTLHAE